MRTIRILLSLSLATSAFAAADLQIGFGGFGTKPVVEPNTRVTYYFNLFNNGDATAELPTLKMPLPPGARLIGVNTVVPTAACSESDGVVSCTALPVDPKKYGVIAFDVFAPSVGGAYTSVATLTWLSSSVSRTASALLNVFRDFRITSSADSGPGTLRQTILDANAICLDTATCRITFDLGAPTATIVPLTPLPAITACNAFITTGIADQTAFDVPRRVAISGEKLKQGDGLVVQSPCVSGVIEIRGLSIYGFPWNGIDALDSDAVASIDNCFIGVDETGTIERGNGLRGIASFARGILRVGGSIISGNRRSGVFVWSAASASVGGSRITDNGASGIFTNADRFYVQGNTIAHNADFGIAIAKPVSLATVVENSIYENGVLGIDRGLDFITVNDPLVPNAPVITDATYDAATNTTVITARWDATPEQLAHFGHFPRIYLFANTKLDGYGRAEAERPIRNEPMTLPQHVSRVAGDYRGQIITAFVTVYRFSDDAYAETSEISDGVTVQ